MLRDQTLQTLSTSEHACYGLRAYRKDVPERLVAPAASEQNSPEEEHPHKEYIATVLIKTMACVCRVALDVSCLI